MGLWGVFSKSAPKETLGRLGVAKIYGGVNTMDSTGVM